MYLEKINSPEDIKQYTAQDRKKLAEEMRQAIIQRVSVHGGHLGPDLGFVEASIALHTVFNSPEDKIVFDVSHQCNPLLLTARKLMRIMLGTMAQLHLSQNFEHALLALRLPHSEVFQLQIHIFLNGKFVDKIEVLEHEADATLAIGGALTLLQMTHFLVIQPILALRRTIQ